jgi:hypothetical protein
MTTKPERFELTSARFRAIFEARRVAARRRGAVFHAPLQQDQRGRLPATPGARLWRSAGHARLSFSSRVDETQGQLPTRRPRPAASTAVLAQEVLP